MSALGVLLMFSLVLPVNAFAGVFDIFSTPAQAYSEGDSENVQTMELLEPVRNLDPEEAVGGGGITIIDGTVLAAVSVPTTDDAGEVTYNSGQISVYVVKDGDSLSQIAEMFNVSVNTIAWANELGRDRVIQPDQKLVILPVNGVTYTVEKGDTIASIAKEFEGDEQEIREYNNLYDEKVAVGTEIIIPGGEAHTHDHDHETTAPVYSAPSTSYVGYYSHPLPGAVRTQGIHGYNGVDYGAPVGTPIRAAASGNVIISRAGGWNGGYGSYVVIRHPNGTQTLYAHNSANAVVAGEYVSAGEVIGYVGNTGRSTGPHLHFEVRGAKNPF